jgi:hypothetical protein
VPTKLPRHSITETAPVREALDDLRRRGLPVELPDLVVRGARERLREADAEQQSDAEREALRRRLLKRMESGQGLDLDALAEAHESGWSHT